MFNSFLTSIVKNQAKIYTKYCLLENFVEGKLTHIEENLKS